MQNNLNGQILDLLYQGLLAHKQKTTANFLGDRSKYIGMSDIARATNCLRAAVAGKLNFNSSANHKSPQPVSPAMLSKELRLQRGHWFEAGVAQALNGLNIPYLHQLEIKTIYHEVPITAHLDFVLPQPGSDCLQIVEVKSSSNIPDSIYASYEMQIHGQLGMLYNLWNQPCFSIKDGSGQYLIRNYTFPGLAKKILGLKMPDDSRQVQLEGSILMLSMDSARVFGTYEPNQLAYGVCLQLAEQIWNNLQQVKNRETGLNHVATVQGFNPLCDWCDYNATCPRLDGIYVSDLEKQLLAVQNLKAQKEALNTRIKMKETQLKNAYLNIAPGGEWVSAKTLRYRVAECDGRKSLDVNMLQQQLSGNLSAEHVENLIAASHKICAPHRRIYISPINNV